MSSSSSSSSPVSLSVKALEDATNSILNNSFDADSKVCFITVIKLLDNVLHQPTNDKVRMIRIQNPNFQQRVGCRPGGIEFLVACGFVRQRDEPGLLTKPNDPTLEEHLVLHKHNEQQEHLIRARRLLETRCIRDLHVKFDELPAYKPPPPPVTVSTTTAGASSSSAFNPYVGQRFDAASAALGTNLGPDANYVSRTETQLKALEQKQKMLEKKLQSNIQDREWKAYKPGETVMAVQPQLQKQPSSSSSGGGGGGHTDASLLKQRLQQQQIQREKQEQFTTKAMRDLEKLQKQNVYTHTLLTIQFSDGCKVTGKFLPKEKIRVVMQSLAEECFADANEKKDFELYVTPPRQVLDPKSTLEKEGLVPAAKIYVGWKSMGPPPPKQQAPGSYLRPNLFTVPNKVEAFPTSKPIAQSTTASSKSKNDDDDDKKSKASGSMKPESREDNLLRRMLGGAGGGTSRLTGGGGGSSAKTNKDASKKPKWFKG